LPDGRLVFFGYQREQSVPTATVVLFSADLKTKQTFFFEPRWTSNRVLDAVSAGKAGEFATIRDIRPIQRWPNEKRQGLVLAFVRVK
jgi:hypothetical protein